MSAVADRSASSSQLPRTERRSLRAADGALAPSLLRYGKLSDGDRVTPASLFKIRSPSVGLASDVPIRQPSTFSSSIFSTLCRYVTAVEGCPLVNACSASARYLTS
jgi:hypothetical protein